MTPLRRIAIQVTFNPARNMALHSFKDILPNYFKICRKMFASQIEMEEATLKVRIMKPSSIRGKFVESLFKLSLFYCCMSIVKFYIAGLNSSPMETPDAQVLGFFVLLDHVGMTTVRIGLRWKIDHVLDLHNMLVQFDAGMVYNCSHSLYFSILRIKHFQQFRMEKRSSWIELGVY